MATTTRTTSVTRTTVDRYGREPTELQETTTDVVVLGLPGTTQDVSTLRDLVRALDAAGAPGNARVEFTRHEGQLTQLYVRWQEDPAE